MRKIYLASSWRNLEQPEPELMYLGNPITTDLDELCFALEAALP